MVAIQAAANQRKIPVGITDARAAEIDKPAEALMKDDHVRQTEIAVGKHPVFGGRTSGQHFRKDIG